MDDDRRNSPRIGESLFGRYTVEELIGRGSSSAVFRVRDVATGSPYALKYPTSGVSAFLEREVLFRLALPAHRNVVSLVAAELDAREQPYLFLEHMDRGTLRDRLRQRAWPVETAMPVLRDIAEGMAHANRSGEVAHLDLKPENILFTRADAAAKVADFGLVRQVRMDPSAYPSVASTTGTLGYQAPEIVLATGSVSESCDVYSFGLIALEMLTGSLPEDEVDPAEFYGSEAGRSFFLDFSSGRHPLSSLVPDEDVRVFLSSCLAYEADERTQTFWAVLEQLGRLGVRARPEPGRQAEPGPEQAARRALSRARILWREGDEEGALSAVNACVLFSRSDPRTRIDALGLGAEILECRGLTDDAENLRSLCADPGASRDLTLDAVPVAPSAQVTPLPGHGMRHPGVDPWALAESPMPGHEREDERDRAISAVQQECEKGRYHAALDIARYVLPRNRVLGLKLASIVFWTSREDLLKAPQPPTELDYEDPRFDPIRVECGQCRALGWLSFGATVLGGGSPAGLLGSTAFAQCAECALTLCGACRTAAANTPLSPSVDVMVCPVCRRRMTWAGATGRTRPWDHELPGTPVSAAFLVRSGPVPVMEDSWLRTVLLGASPDLLIHDVPLHRTHIARARSSRELADVAVLVSERHAGSDAADRTEVVHGTDADGMPFALAKVLRQPLRKAVRPPDQLSEAHRIEHPHGFGPVLIDDTTHPLTGARFTIRIPDAEPSPEDAGRRPESTDRLARRLVSLLDSGARWQHRLTQEQARLWFDGPHLDDLLSTRRPVEDWIRSQVGIREIGHQLDREGGKPLMREVAELASRLRKVPGTLDEIALVWDGIGSWEA
ncbi:Serine/threonine-protein kinase PknD [Streptomyces glaucescens]